MSYADFTLSKLQSKFGFILEENTDLFADIPAVTTRAEFAAELVESSALALKISTEKARSELIIAPILMEAWRLSNHGFGLFSGVEFTVDTELGLSGVCDYIITRSPEQFFVKAPAVLLVEAKNEDMRRGYAQCIAEMLAAQRFNESEGTPCERIHGAVTIGERWKFLQLRGNSVTIDSMDYYIILPGKILGILLHMTTG